MDSNALRQRYLSKVRAVEYSIKVRDSNGAEGEIDSPFSVDFSEEYSMVDSQFDSNEVAQTTDHESRSYDISSGRFYPRLGLTSSMIEDYKNNASIDTSSNVGFNMDSFNRGGQITLPSGSRHSNAASMVKYIESVGGIKGDRSMFGPINRNKFTLAGLNDQELRNNGNWLRLDMIAYLEELHRRVSSKIGVSKLQINSAYRSTRVNYDLYSNQIRNGLTSKRVYWDTHMAGMAVDISAFGMDRSIIADEAYKMGFGGIAIGNSFVHIDCNTKSYWNYSGLKTYRNPNNPGSLYFS